VVLQVLVKAGLAQKAGWTAMGPILACGDTNAAVDNLVEGLLNRKLKVVRLGQPAKVLRLACCSHNGTDDCV
jgi:hypothetical protein